MTLSSAGLPCREVHYSRHAFERMFQRGIPPDAVETLLSSGEIIASYPDDRPYPTYLILGKHEDLPLHAVIALYAQSGICQVVTVYRPDPDLWDASFKTRKQP
jgi:hypothetical protein